MKKLFAILGFFISINCQAQQRLLFGGYPILSPNVTYGIWPSKDLLFLAKYNTINIGIQPIHIGLELKNHRYMLGFGMEFNSNGKADSWHQKKVGISSTVSTPKATDYVFEFSTLKYNTYTKYGSSGIGYVAKLKVSDGSFIFYSNGNSLETGPIEPTTVPMQPHFYNEVYQYRVYRTWALETGLNYALTVYSGWNGIGCEIFGQFTFQLPYRYTVNRKKIGTTHIWEKEDSFFGLPKFRLQAGLRVWIFTNIQKRSKFRDEFKE